MTTFDEHRSAAPDADAMQQLLLQSATLTEFLTDLTRAVSTTTGHRVGITTRNESGPFTAALSHDDVLNLDELQYADGDGPCLQALRDEMVVRVDDMSTETRWAPYPQQVAALGVRSVLSHPLRGTASVVGALNVYSFDDHDPASAHLAQVEDLSGRVGSALELALRLGRQADLIANLQTALTSRSTIDQAIGVLMAQQRCDAATAFGLLRSASQGRNVKLRDIAAQVVERVGTAGPQGNGWSYGEP